MAYRDPTLKLGTGVETVTEPGPRRGPGPRAGASRRPAGPPPSERFAPSPGPRRRRVTTESSGWP
eukprot:489966-Hanusia_phi.AAC.1